MNRLALTDAELKTLARAIDFAWHEARDGTEQAEALNALRNRIRKEFDEKLEA